MKRLDTLWCKGETMLFLVHISSVAQVGPAAPGCRYSWIIQSHAVHHIHAALGVGRPCGNTHEGGWSVYLVLLRCVCFFSWLFFTAAQRKGPYHSRVPAWKMMLAQTSVRPWQVSTGPEQIFNPPQLHCKASPETKKKVSLFNILGQTCIKWQQRSQLTVADGQQHKMSENNSLHVVLMWRFFTQVSAQRDEEGGELKKHALTITTQVGILWTSLTWVNQMSCVVIVCCWWSPLFSLVTQHLHHS